MSEIFSYPSSSYSKLLLSFLPTKPKEQKPSCPRLKDYSKEDEWKVLSPLYFIKWKKLYTYNHAASEEEEFFREQAIFYLALRLGIPHKESYAVILLKWLSWFTTWRLFLLRDGREHNVFQHIYSCKFYGYGDILQFSYSLEIFLCLYQVGHNPEIIYDNEWQSTFSNALVWLIVNGLSYFTQCSPLNLIGFFFDIWHDWYYTKKEIEALQQVQRDEKLSNKAKTDIDTKIKELEYKLKRVTVVAIGIFIGMAIFYLNPIAGAWAPIVGSTIVILFGAIIGNLGNRLCQWDKLLMKLKLPKPPSFKHLLWDELKVIGESFLKFLKESGEALFPTLYNNLANFKEDEMTALASIIFAALPSAIFASVCIHYSSLLLFCACAPHLLLPIGILLAATELCVQLASYLFSSSGNAEDINHLWKKTLSNFNHKKSFPLTGDCFIYLFSQFSRKELEALAKAADLTLKSLLHHINYWTHVAEQTQLRKKLHLKQTPGEQPSHPQLFDCRYSFFGFLGKIQDKANSLTKASILVAPGF